LYASDGVVISSFGSGIHTLFISNEFSCLMRPYLFREANSEIRGTDNVQRQISKLIFTANGGYRIYYPSNILRKSRSCKNWGISLDYFPCIGGATKNTAV